MIVGLGLMRTRFQLTVLMIAVVLLILQGIAINRLASVPYPLWTPNPKITARASHVDGQASDS